MASTPININQLVNHCMEQNVLNLESFQAILDSITIKAVPPAPAAVTTTTTTATADEGAVPDGAAEAASKTGGSKKKRTVTIKSNAMPKTVKGLKTRKKLLKKKIKDAEKKVKLNKNRVIKLKGGSGNNNSSMGVITYRGEDADIIEDNLVKKNGQILTPPHFMNYVNHKITTGNDILTWKKKKANK